MSDTVETERSQLDNLQAQLRDVNTLVARLSEDATDARLVGDEDHAEDLERKKLRAEARAESLRAAEARQLDAVVEAEGQATVEAAERRVDELAVLIRTRLTNADNSRTAAAKRLPEVVDQARDALEVEDDVRRIRLEIDLLARLYDVDAPDDLPAYDVDARDELLGVIAEAAAALRRMARSYPLDARSGSRSHVLRRHLNGLARGEISGRGLLSDATRRLWERAHDVEPMHDK